MQTKFNFRFLVALLVGIFMSVNVFAQDLPVTGTIIDELGEPVLGANVVVKGTTNGATTDLDGNFSFRAPKGSTIVISFIGYSNQEVVFEGQPLRITLKEDSELLEDVVVIGYGTAKKNDMTGSVLALKPDDMSKGITTSTQDMLVGKAPGVSVIGDGTPGGSATIRVRGGASLNASNNPLYVIDGLAIDGNQATGQSNLLSIVNPNDIESMTILKDASATAIYGSRASNGVIIITTKKGRKGMKPQLSYNGSVTFSTARKFMDVLDAREYREFVGATAPELLDGLGFSNTDWQRQIFHQATSHEHSLSLSGATRWMPYRVSLGFADQQGILIDSESQRFNAGLNLSPSLLSDHLKLNVSAKYTHVRDNYADAGAVGKAVSADPTQPVHNGTAVTGGFWQALSSGMDGTLANWDAPEVNTNAVGNPVALIKQKSNIGSTNTVMGNIEADYKIHGFEDLHIHASVGGEYGETRQDNEVSPYSAGNNYYGWTGFDQTYKYELQGNIYAQYMHDFEHQSLDVMVGAEQSHNHRLYWNEGAGLWAGNKLSGERHDESLRSEKERLYRTSLVSYFGRLNYTLMDRYLLTATMRLDGSSRFAKGNQWGKFPAVALAWKLNEERFLKSVSWLSDLKLRAGWGITGQQEMPAGYDFYYLPTYVVSDQYGQYTIGKDDFPTLRPSTFNEDLQWEKTTTYNIGLDFGALNGRITASIDAYQRKTTDLLAEVSVASGTNFGNYVLQNIGSMENKGIEFNFDARIIQTRDFTWQLSYNVGYNHNEVTSLNTGSAFVGKEGATYGLAGSNYVTGHAVGHPVNSFWVFQQVYDEAGKPIEGLFVDRNGDGVISNDDRYFYKKPTADVTMGMTNKFMYRKWDLSFTWRASLNNYIYAGNLASCARCNSGAYIYSNNDYHNTTAEAVALGWTGKTNYQYSDYFVQNASFLRCDNINLGYSFDKFLACDGFRGLSGRLYFTVQNPIVITAYDGIDPEIQNAVDSSVYPKPISYQLGVSLNF